MRFFIILFRLYTHPGCGFDRHLYYWLTTSSTIPWNLRSNMSFGWLERRRRCTGNVLNWWIIIWLIKVPIDIRVAATALSNQASEERFMCLRLWVVINWVANRDVVFVAVVGGVLRSRYFKDMRLNDGYLQSLSSAIEFLSPLASIWKLIGIVGRRRRQLTSVVMECGKLNCWRHLQEEFLGDRTHMKRERG